MRRALHPVLCHHRVRKLVTHSPHLEHYGFICYAAAEVFSLGHSAIWFVAAYLLATGVLAELVTKTGE